MASAKILAEYTGRKLYVNWVPSKECNVEWHELFLNQLESMPLPLSSFEVGINLYDDSVIPMSWYRDIPRLLVCNESHLVAVHTCRNFQPEAMANEAYADAKASFYKNLRSVDTVQNTVTDMQRRYFKGCDVIGVHIRRNDHLTFLKKDHRLVCPTRMFIEAMENVLRTNPETKFFLATDNKKDEELIRRLFTSAVIVHEKEEPSRNTTKGMQDALVDWLLLSKTSGIIASYASSFSEEASAVNRIKLEVVVRENELLRTHFKVLLADYFTAHLRVLKEKGLKGYLLHSFDYRKGQILHWGRRKSPSGDKDS